VFATGYSGTAVASYAMTLRENGRAGERPSAMEAARGFAIMLGGPIMLAAAGSASVLSTVRSVAAGRRPGLLATSGCAALATYALAVRPWMRRWGATADELAAPLPGDQLVPDAGGQSTRAVTIDAHVAEVWPWLAQLGQDRGGFYSYEWLENLAGCRMANADRIHPEWQHRDIGETVYLHPASGLKVQLFEPDRVLALEGWGALVLQDSGEGHTRLIVRTRQQKGAAGAAYYALLQLPHFVMERRMLLGIKQRAERAARERRLR